MILGDDIYQRARYAVMDIEIDDETLALETVKAVGPGGHFLGQAHTRKHMRDAGHAGHHPRARSRGRLPRPVEVARERADGSTATTSPSRSRRTRRPSWRGSWPPPTPSCASGGRKTGEIVQAAAGKAVKEDA